MNDEEILKWLEDIQRKINLNSRSAIKEIDELKKEIKEDSDKGFLYPERNEESDTSE